MSPTRGRTLPTPKEGTQRLALILEYEGTRYHGSQLQSNAPSIQGELERALERLTGHETRVQAAGRTDAGVHAQGQVVAFTTPAPYTEEVFLRALNHYLPRDIAVLAAHRVAPTFDPRRHAVARLYRYTTLNRETPSPLLMRFTHQEPRPLDAERMDAAARALEGRRDFAPWSGPVAMGRSTWRHLCKARVTRQDNLVLLEMKANAFLPQQVRRTAGVLVRVGLGQMSLEAFRRLVEEGAPGSAGPALPPQGLCLVEVTYRDFPPPGLEEERDPKGSYRSDAERGVGWA